jgi:RNA polymerase sigma-70 factor, ECF subfamily
VVTEPASGGHLVSVTGSVQSGVEGASSFDQLYRAQVGFVWRVLQRLGVAASALDDAVQDVFVVVHRRQGDFSTPDEGRPLLAGIAVRVARDYRRSLSRAQRRELQVAESSQRFAEDDPHRVAERSQAVQLALQLLEFMNAERREVFVMAELEELTAPEIAAALELNVNTVYSRLRLARADFEAAVAKHLAREAS